MGFRFGFFLTWSSQMKKLFSHLNRPSGPRRGSAADSGARANYSNASADEWPCTTGAAFLCRAPTAAGHEPHCWTRTATPGVASFLSPRLPQLVVRHGRWPARLSIACRSLGVRRRAQGELADSPLPMSARSSAALATNRHHYRRLRPVTGKFAMPGTLELG